MPAEKDMPTIETVETAVADREYETVKDILNDVHDENVEIFRQLDPPVTEEEHRKLLRKIDLRLPPFLFFLYIFCWLDRANLGNMYLMDFKQDIGLTSSAASLAVAIIYIGTFTGDMFTNLGMRYFPPSKWVSGAMIIWASITLLMAAVTNPAGIYAARLFLGIFEAAFTSGAPYIFTFWFTRKEWGRRISLYFAATPTAGAFGGWIAYGIQYIETDRLKNWQILLILEGSLTLIMAVVSLYMLPDRPHNTKWLTPREREVAEWRMLKDGNKTHGHFGFRDILQGFKDWRLMAGIVVFMTQNLSMYTVTTFTPTIVNSFGYTTARSQLMTAPPYCVGIVLVFVVAHISDRLQRRASLYIINTAVVLVGYLMLAVIDVENTSARYGALFLIIPGLVSGVVLSIGNITDNCCGDLKKAIATGLFQAMGSFMGIASGYMLPATAAPKYTIGFWALFAVTLFGGLVALFQAIYYTRVNAERDRKYSYLSPGAAKGCDYAGLRSPHLIDNRTAAAHVSSLKLTFWLPSGTLRIQHISTIILLPQLIVFAGLCLVVVVVVNSWRQVFSFFLRLFISEPLSSSAAAGAERPGGGAGYRRNQTRSSDRLFLEQGPEFYSTARELRAFDSLSNRRDRLSQNTSTRNLNSSRPRDTSLLQAEVNQLSESEPGSEQSVSRRLDRVAQLLNRDGHRGSQTPRSGSGSTSPEYLEYLLTLIHTSRSSATSREVTDLTTLFETFLSSINWDQESALITEQARQFLFKPVAQLLVERSVHISTIRVGPVSFVHDRYLLFNLPYDRLSTAQKECEIVAELSRLLHFRIVERRLSVRPGNLTERGTFDLTSPLLSSDSSSSLSSSSEQQEGTDSGVSYPSALGLRAFFTELEARAVARSQILGMQPGRNQQREQAEAQIQAHIQAQIRAQLRRREQPDTRTTAAPGSLEATALRFLADQTVPSLLSQEEATQQSESTSSSTSRVPQPLLPLPVASSIIGPGAPQVIIELPRRNSGRNEQTTTSTSSLAANSRLSMENPTMAPPTPRKEYSKEQWEARLAETSISKSDLNYMILNYLVVEGYQSAAMKFAQEAGLLSSNQSILNGSIKDRMTIKSLIHSGKIQDAIEKINDTDPELLDTNTALHFSLLRLQLIELIRHSYKSKSDDSIQPALDFAASHLAARAPSNPQFLQDLERTMALLCFPPDNLIPQLKELMDIKLRIKIAEDVNNVLLERQGMGGDSKIKSLVKLWSWASETLAERKVDIPPLTKSDLF
ncbi:Tna1p [Sugiyamaella lignohabitans]|uniref:Tna1p n=1 Tax=Sugiyamaella lignohabitans TaxID=796027 RepID=A0A167DMM9_9ASCO|nr:Tna1p [Sugiyamaella lignohabitans]ANB13078.1 Tna1p [Sugiyamaella lignohabitans]